MTARIGRNDPCPCGSGKKWKKCCGGAGRRTGFPGLPHTKADRASTLEKLEAYMDEVWGEVEGEASEIFWGRHVDREEELPPNLGALAQDAEEAWCAFDFDLGDGETIADLFAAEVELGAGERSFIDAMRRTTVRISA